MPNKILKPILFVAALLPLAALVVRGFQQELGANPIEVITHQTGLWTLILLLASLAITPLRRITGLHWLIQYRRMIGLFAFFYGCLHLMTYLWLDQFFDFGSIAHDVYKRPFITAGFTSWLLLLPLALTSTQRAIRRLGRRWQLLHRLAYFAAFAAVVHFIWLVKRDISEPVMYATVFGVLMAIRIFFWLRGTRRAPSRSAPTAAEAD